MRTFKEIQTEIHSRRSEQQEVDAKLYEELREAFDSEIRIASMEDALAGRKNSCKSAAWQLRDDGSLHCSYCGSIHPEEAVKLLKTPGTHYSGSDHKYGWPHKLYIGDGKFYNKHIADAPDEIFTEFAKLSLSLFDIGWEKKEDGSLWWNCPKTSSMYGHQRWGIVGQVTCSCGCVGGKSVAFCFCTAEPKCHPDPVIPDATHS